MHNVSQKYYNILNSPHWAETVIQIGGTGEVKIRNDIAGTVYGADMITKISQKGDILNWEAPGIGNFVSRKLEFKMLVPDTAIGAMTRIVPYSRIANEDGASEWIPKGVFYIDSRKKEMVDTEAATISITAYDAALMAQSDYDTGALSWPATDIAVVSDICQKMGITFDATGIDAGFLISKPDEKSCLEVLQGIAALYGANFTLDDFGVMRLVILGTTGEATGIQCSSLKMGALADPIGAVSLYATDNVYSAGSGVALNGESPWASGEAVKRALANVSGYRYLAFSAQNAIIAPHMELGDTVTVGGVNAIMHSWSIDMGTYVGTVGSAEEYEVNRQYPYRSTASRAAGAASSAKKAAEKAQGDIIENYNQLVAALNQEDGVPEDLAAGLKNYVRYDLGTGDMLAHSKLYAAIGEKAKAEIDVYAVEADGQTKTFATILADQITLQSAVKDAFTELDLKAEKSTVEELNDTVTEIQSAQASLTTRVSNAESTLTLKADNKTVTELSGRVTTVETAQTDLTNRVGDAETALSTKAESSTVTALSGRVTAVEEAQSSLSTRVGNAESSLLQKVSVTAFNEAIAAEQEAITELSSSVDGVKASLTLKAAQSDVDALSGSVATLQADVVELQGNVEILGNLSIDSGRLKVAKSIYTDNAVFANKFYSNDSTIVLGGTNNLTVSCDTSISSSGIYFGGNTYSPTTITSTTGDRAVLGY